MDSIVHNDMDEIEPNKLFLKLCENATTRKKRSLERIHKACENQYKSRAKDFSIPTIAKLIASEGGLSEQGLRNKNGEDYRLLINAWAEYSDGSTKKISQQKKISGINDEILSSISNTTTRALVGMLMAENRKLKREVSLLKEQTTFTIDMRQSENKNTEVNQDSVLVCYSPELTQTELDALREAISEDFMHNNGWTISNGRVKQNGFTIYKLGYIDAIKKILKEY